MSFIGVISKRLFSENGCTRNTVKTAVHITAKMETQIVIVLQFMLNDDEISVYIETGHFVHEKVANSNCENKKSCDDFKTMTKMFYFSRLIQRY